jgi:hypothetical protein
MTRRERESSKYNIRKNNKFPLLREESIKKNNKMNRDGNSCLPAGREPVLNFVVF